MLASNLHFTVHQILTLTILSLCNTEMGGKQRDHIRTNVPIFIELSLLKKGAALQLWGGSFKF